MIGKRFSKRWTLTWLLWIVLFIPTFMFFTGRAKKKEDKLRDQRIQEQSQRNREEARAEAEQPSGEGPSVEVVTSGRYAGMTVEAAKAAEKKRIPVLIAAAKKRRKWELRRDALDKRFLENSRKSSALSKAVIASADAELDAMLSLYALMSPEQLEYARQEALKMLPAEKVEAFFDDLANHRTTKTPEQLTKDAQDILKSREAHEIVDREIRVEREQINLEYEVLKQTEPPIPW